MATNRKFGVLTINNAESVTQTYVLHLGVNIIGSDISADVRLHDHNIKDKQCIIEVQEDGTAYIAALLIFPNTKVNDTPLQKNKKVVLNTGDVIKIGNKEITYSNQTLQESKLREVPKQIKSKIFPFNTPRRRSFNPGALSAKKLQATSFHHVNKKPQQGLFPSSSLVVKQNLPPKHNDDWPSEPLQQDQFPFVGNFSPRTKTLKDEMQPDTTTFESIPEGASMSFCTSTTGFDKNKAKETIIPDVKSVVTVATSEIGNFQEIPSTSFSKPSVRTSTRLSARQNSLSLQNVNTGTSKPYNCRSSCATPTKSSMPLRSRITMSEHKLSNESQPSFMQTTLESPDNCNMNSSTPTSVSRVSRNLSLVSTPASIIKKVNSTFKKSPSRTKSEKINTSDNSDAREKSKSRLFNQSSDFEDGDTLAISTDTSSFVYETAPAQSAIVETEEGKREELERELIELSTSLTNKNLKYSSIVSKDSDISGIASLDSTLEAKGSMVAKSPSSILGIVNSTTIASAQTNLSFKSAISNNDKEEEILKSFNIEGPQNYSSITISSCGEDSDDFLSSQEIVLPEDGEEPIVLTSDDEVEIVGRRKTLDIGKKKFENKSNIRSSICVGQVARTPGVVKSAKKKSSTSGNMSHLQKEILSLVEDFSSETEEEDDTIPKNTSSLPLRAVKTPTPSNHSLNEASVLQSGRKSQVFRISEVVNVEEEVDENVPPSANVQLTQSENLMSTRTPILSVRESRRTLQVVEDEFSSENKSANGSSLNLALENSISGDEKLNKTGSALQTSQIIDDSSEDDIKESVVISSRKSARFSKAPQTSSVHNIAGDSQLRSCKKSKVTEDNTGDFDVQEILNGRRSGRVSTFFKTSIAQNSPAGFEARSSRKSETHATPLSQTSSEEMLSIPDKIIELNPEDFESLVDFQGDLSEVFIDDNCFAESNVTDSNESSIISVQISNDEANILSMNKSKTVFKMQQTPQNSPAALKTGVTRKSRGIQALSYLESDNNTTEIIDSESEEIHFEEFNSSVENKSRRNSKVNHTPQNSPAFLKVGSTRKSLRNQTSLLQLDVQDDPTIEIVSENEDVELTKLNDTTMNKSKRVSRLNQTHTILNSPSSAIESTNNSTMAQNSNSDDENELSETEDSKEATSIINKSKRISILNQTPIQNSPDSSESISMLLHTSNPGSEIEESQDSEENDVSTVNRSKRMSKYNLTTHIQNSPNSGVRSTRKSTIGQTPSAKVEGEESESKNLKDTEVSTMNKSRRASRLNQTIAKNSPAVSGTRSTRRSTIMQTPSTEINSKGSENKDFEENGSNAIKSKRASTLNQTPVIKNSLASGVRSTRNSKIVQTPSDEIENEESEFENLEEDDAPTANTSKTASRLNQTPVHNSPAGIRSTRKSAIAQTPIAEIENKESESESSEEGDASTLNTSRRLSRLNQTPVQNSPAFSGVRSTRKSKVGQTPRTEFEKEESKSESSEEEGVSTVNTSKRSSWLDQTPAHNSPVSRVRSTRKSTIVKSPNAEIENEESEDDASTVNTSKRSSRLIQTPVQNLPDSSGVRSTRKSAIAQTPEIENEDFKSESSEEENASTLNTSKRSFRLNQNPAQNSPVFSGSTRKSTIVVQTPSEEIENEESESESSAEEVASTANVSKRLSKLNQTPLQNSPTFYGVRSTRKSKIDQTPSAAIENEESENLKATDVSVVNKSRRPSRLNKNSVQNSPAPSDVRSTRKSTIVVHTPSAAVIENEEVELESSEEEEESSTVNISKRLSRLNQTPVQNSPVISGVRSTRKSTMGQTHNAARENEKSENLKATDISIVNKSRRASRLNQTPVEPISPATSGVRSTRKSTIVSQTPSAAAIENEVESESSEEKEDISTVNISKRSSRLNQTPVQISPAISGVRSTRKSKIGQTPSSAAIDNEESENMKATDVSVVNKSMRASRLNQTPVQNSPASFGVRSTRKSTIVVRSASVIENEEVESESSEEGDTSAANISKRSSKLYQTPVQNSLAISGVRSTRKSTIVQTPSVAAIENEAVESESSEEEDASTVNISKKSFRLNQSSVQNSPAISGVRSTRKSTIVQTPSAAVIENEAVDSESSEEEEDTSTVNISKGSSRLNQTPVQNSPAISGVRSTRKSKIGQTPSAALENEESENLNATNVSIVNKSRRASRLNQTPVQNSPASSGVRSTRKSMIVVQTPSAAVIENEEAESETSEEEEDTSTVNISKRSSRLNQTPVQDSPAISGVRSVRKQTVGQTSSTEGESEESELENTKVIDVSAVNKSRRISKLNQTLTKNSPSYTGVRSTRKSKIVQTSSTEIESKESQSEATEEENDSNVNKSKRVSRLNQTRIIQNSPASGARSTRKSTIVPSVEIENEKSELEHLEEEDPSTINASKRLSRLSKTPIQSSSASSGVKSTRRSRIVQTSSNEIESQGFESEDLEEENDSNVNYLKRSSTLNQTPIIQISPASEVRSTRKSMAARTPGVKVKETEFEEINTSGANKSKRISRFQDTPTVQSSPARLEVHLTRKSTIVNTPNGQNEVFNSNVSLSDTKRKSLRKSQSVTPISQHGKVKIQINDVTINLENSHLELEDLKSNSDSSFSAKNKSLETSTLFKTPSMQGSPAATVRSTRKSKIIQTPEMLNSPVVPTVRLTRKSPLNSSVVSRASTRTSIISSASLKRSLDETFETEDLHASNIVGNRSKRSKSLMTPSIQNSPIVAQVTSAVKPTRMSKRSQVSLIEDELESKTLTPKNSKQFETSFSSDLKQKRNTILLDLEETESPVASTSKSGNTSKFLLFNTPTDNEESVCHTESDTTSPAYRKLKKGKGESRSDLTNTHGVKTLFRTSRAQKQPHNDLTNVAGVKKLMATPKVAKSPINDLTNIKGVKKLLSSPKVQNSPVNDLTNVRGVKKLMGTPVEQKEPENNLEDVRGVKELMVTPKPRRSANLSGLGDFFLANSKGVTPKPDFSEARNVKKISSIKGPLNSKVVAKKIQNSPKNDLNDVRGVKKMFAEEEAQYRTKFNISGVAEFFNKSENLFDNLVGKKSYKTYGRKTSKSDTPVKSSLLSETPELSEEVVNWVNTQDFNKGEVVENLTPIKSVKKANVATSKNKKAEIHSSTPVNKGGRGILRDIMNDNDQDADEANSEVADKNLKKVQFLDDSNLRRSKRTPVKITTEFILPKSKVITNGETASRGHKRKVVEENEEDKADSKFAKIVQEETNSNNEIKEKVVRKPTKKGAAKKGASKPKKATRATSKWSKSDTDDEKNDDVKEDKVEEVSKSTKKKTNAKSSRVEETEKESEAEEVLQSRRGTRKTKTDVKSKQTEESDEEEEVIETRRGAKKIAPKSSKKTVEKVKVAEDEKEVEEVEVPKNLRRGGRVIARSNKKGQEKTGLLVDMKDEAVEEIEEVSSTRTRRGIKKVAAPFSKQLHEESDNEEVEEVPALIESKGKAVKEIEEVALTTGTRRGVKNVAADSSKKLPEESDDEEMEDVPVPKERKGKAVKEIEEVVLTTRTRRGVKNVVADSSKKVLEESDDEETEEVSAPKKSKGKAVKEIQEVASTTRTRRGIKKVAPDFSKKVPEESESDDEEVEEVPASKESKGKAIKEIEEVALTTRTRRGVKKVAVDSGKKVLLESEEEVAEVASPNGKKNEAVKDIVEVSSTRTRRGIKKVVGSSKTVPVESESEEELEEVAGIKGKKDAPVEEIEEVLTTRTRRGIKKVAVSSGKKVSKELEAEVVEEVAAPKARRVIKKADPKSNKDENKSAKIKSLRVAKKTEPERKQSISIAEIESSDVDGEVQEYKPTRGQLKRTSEQQANIDKEISIQDTQKVGTRGSTKTAKKESIEISKPLRTGRGRLAKSQETDESLTNTTLENSKIKKQETPVILPKIKQKGKKTKLTEDDESEEEPEVSKTTRSRAGKTSEKRVSDPPKVAVSKINRTRATNKKNVKTPEVKDNAKAAGKKRKLYSLDDTPKVDDEQVTEAVTKKGRSTRNEKQKAEATTPVIRSSKRLRK